MFDFFRNMLHEAREINTTAPLRENTEAEYSNSTDNPIFTSNIKISIFAIGALYAVSTIPAIIKTWGISGISVVIAQSVTLVLLDVCTCIFLLVKDKKYEIAALITGVLFLILLFTSVIF